MKSIHYIIYIALAVLSFTACQEDELVGNVQGGIRITLAEEVGVDVSTRSTPEELDIPIATDFKIEATNSAGDKKYSGTFKKDETIPLDAGTYEVIAYYGIYNTLALDAPYYEGTAENINVKEGYTTPVTLTCKVANALLSIRINEDDKEKFEASFKNPSFQLKVDEKSLENSDTTKSFYFPAGSTITKLAFSKDGSEYQELEGITWPSSIEAADHIIVTVGIEPAPSGISLKVEKLQVEEVPISETIPLEWLPKPKVEADGFTNNALTFVETETPPAKLNLDLASALQDMRLKFNFGDAQFSHLNRDTGYLYSNAEDKAVIETTLGISVSDDNINLNNLLAKIQTNAGETTTNTIEVDVKANNRWSSEDETANRTYTITCNKPVFKVDAYPGNIWTKEFTMNALREEQVESGDFTKLSGDMTYQYSADGQTGWTNLSDGMRQDQLQPGTTYYIRGLYRDAVPGEVTEVKTYPVIDLENGNMEDWRSEGEDGKLYLGYGARYYWTNWATLNELTCDHCPLTAYAYNTRSGTRPITGSDAYDGATAWIATIGWGYGSTIGGTNHQTPGELFLGSLTNVNHDSDTAVKNYGKTDYHSRPTSVSFIYKYIPYDGDRPDIYVQVLHDDEILGEAHLEEGADSYKAGSLDIEYYSDKIELEPNKLILVFKSGFNSSVQSYGNNGRYGVRFVGSQLYIDNVELVYDK